MKDFSFQNDALHSMAKFPTFPQKNSCSHFDFVCAFTIDYDITNHDFLGEKGNVCLTKLKPTNLFSTLNFTNKLTNHSEIFMTAPSIT